MSKKLIFAVFCFAFPFWHSPKFACGQETLPSHRFEDLPAEIQLRVLADKKSEKWQNQTFSYLADDEMPFRQKVAQLYKRNLDVCPVVTMDQLLIEEFPSHSREVVRIFSARRRIRNDDLISVATELEKDGTASALVKSIETKERERTEETCKSLSSLLSEEELEKLTTILVTRYWLRALEFPLVSERYELSPEQVDDIRRGNDNMTRSIRDALSEGTYSPESSPAAKHFARTLLTFNGDQLREYLIDCGKLVRGDELVSAVENFPSSGRGYLMEALTSKELAE